MAHLRETQRREWIERLVRDLDRIYEEEARKRGIQVLQINPKATVKLPKPGDSRKNLVEWLGHPIRTMTAQEHETLSAYVEQAREALAKGKMPPTVPHNDPPSRG